MGMDWGCMCLRGDRIGGGEPALDDLVGEVMPPRKKDDDDLLTPGPDGGAGGRSQECERRAAATSVLGLARGKDPTQHSAERRGGRVTRR